MKYLLILFVATIARAGLWQDSQGNLYDLPDENPKWPSMGYQAVEVSGTNDVITTTVVTNGSHQVWLDWQAGQIAAWHYGADLESGYAQAGVWLTTNLQLSAGVISGIHQDREDIARALALGPVCPPDFGVTTNSVTNSSIRYQPRGN